MSRTIPVRWIRTAAPDVRIHVRDSVELFIKNRYYKQNLSTLAGSGGLFFCELNSMSPQRSLSAPTALAEAHLGAPLYFRGYRLPPNCWCRYDAVGRPTRPWSLPSRRKKVPLTPPPHIEVTYAQKKWGGAFFASPRFISGEPAGPLKYSAASGVLRAPPRRPECRC